MTYFSLPAFQGPHADGLHGLQLGCVADHEALVHTFSGGRPSVQKREKPIMPERYVCVLCILCVYVCIVYVYMWMCVCVYVDVCILCVQ